MSTPAQKRAQSMRGLLGSVGAGIQHSGTLVAALNAELEADPSMKTKLNRIAAYQVEKFRLELMELERSLQILNEHYRNHPKPTKTKWEKMLDKAYPLD